MRMVIQTLLLASLPLMARAETGTNTQPAAPQTVTYELRDLRPSGLTQYASAVEVVRQYIEFKNEQGRHSLVYEEVAGAPPLRALLALRELADSWESSCALDLECSSRAFCTGDCRSMYYEVSNAPGDVLSPNRSRCKVQYFSCEKAGSAAAPSAPPPAPAAPAVK